MTTEPQHAEREHSEIGASGAYRWWNCPASVTRSRGKPNTSSPAAALGTARHELAEICLRSGQDAIEYVDRVVGGHDVDEKGAADVQLYLDTVRGWPADGDPLQVEVRFTLADLAPPGPMYGTADACRYYPATRTLRIGDYKNGWVPVAIENNMQFKYYALGAMLALGAERPVSVVEGYVVQPNSGGVKPGTFDVIELMEWSVELMDRAKVALDPAAPAAPGSWCRFCPVSGNCREQAAGALAIANLEMPALPPEDLQAVQIWQGGEPVPVVYRDTLLAPVDLSDAELSTILTRAAELKSWLDAVEMEAMRRGGVPGWKLVATRPVQSWVSPDTIADTLDAVFEVQPFAPPKVRSPAQIRGDIATRLYDAAKAAGDKLTKKDAEARARAQLHKFVTSASSGRSLAPESDARPALPAGGSEFAALPSPTTEL